MSNDDSRESAVPPRPWEEETVEWIVRDANMHDALIECSRWLSRIVDTALSGIPGITPCKICGYLPDTPNHETGCPVSRAAAALAELEHVR